MSCILVTKKQVSVSIILNIDFLKFSQLNDQIQGIIIKTINYSKIESFSNQ